MAGAFDRPASEQRPAIPEPGWRDAPLVLLPAIEAAAGAVTAGAAALGPLPWLAALLAGVAAITGCWFRWAVEMRRAAEPGPAPQVESAGERAARQAWSSALFYLSAAGALLLVVYLLMQARPLLPAAFTALLFCEVARALLPRGGWGWSILLFAGARAAAPATGLFLSPLPVPAYLPGLLPPLMLGAGLWLLRSSRIPNAPPVAPLLALLQYLGGASLLLLQMLSRFAYAVDGALIIAAALLVSLPALGRFLADDRPAAAHLATQYAFLGLVLMQVSQAAGYTGFVEAAPLLAAVAVQVWFLRRFPIPPPG